MRIVSFFCFGPTALTVGAGAVGAVWTFFLSSINSLLSPFLWETARYRLKYCLNGPLNPKQSINQFLLQLDLAVITTHHQRRCPNLSLCLLKTLTIHHFREFSNKKCFFDHSLYPNYLF